jgi:hypothetical protein
VTGSCPAVRDKGDRRMSRPSVRLAAILMSLASVAAAAPPGQKAHGGPIETGPGSTTAARKFLEGRWSLLSFEVLPPGEPPVLVKGQGTLVYDAFGNLEMEVRVDERTAQQLETVGIPSTKGLLSMKGRTVIDLQNRTLTYVLEGQPPFGAPSGPLALNRSRHWALEGNVLTLTTMSAEGRPLSRGRWEKRP